VNREVHARFWERQGVKLPRATRHLHICRRSLGPDQARIFGLLLLQEQTPCCASYALRRKTGHGGQRTFSLQLRRAGPGEDKRALMPLGQLLPQRNVLLLVTPTFAEALY